MRKIEALKRPLKVLFCYSNKSLVRAYADYLDEDNFIDSDAGEEWERKFEIYGTVSLYRAKTWLAQSNISGIHGISRPKYLRDPKFKPLKTPYPFDVLVVEYIDGTGEGGRELTTPQLLADINAMGLLNGFLVEREGKEIFRAPLAIVAIIDPDIRSSALLEELLALGVRGIIRKPLNGEEWKRSLLKAYNDVNVGTRAHLKDNNQLEYERKDGSRECLTIVSRELTPDSVEIDRDFREASFKVLKALP